MSPKAYPVYKDSGIEWLGEVPEHWKIKRVKHTTYVKGRIGWQGLKSDEFIDEGPYLVTGTDFNNGNIIWENTYHVSEERYNEDPFIQLQEKDLLITKDGTIGKLAIVKNMPGPACLNSGIFVTRPTDNDYVTEFMHWVLCSNVFTRFIDYMKTGTTISHLYQNVFVEFSFPIPSLEEQRGINSFLKKETERIDALIAKKQRQIGLSQEKRSSLISHAVTKGLDPNVKMKDSGIEWLGKIPEHWTLIKIKHLSMVKRGASPRPIDDPKYFSEEGEYSWVRIADVTASSRYLENTTQKLSDLGKKWSVPLEPGDLFLSIAGSVGKPIITKIKCCIHDGFVYFPNYKYNSEFLYYIFASGQPYFGLGKLGTQLNLNTDTVGDIYIGLPPNDEQKEIVELLDCETARIDALINKVKESIEKLLEYRTAIISAAVTGKIDVTREIGS